MCLKTLLDVFNLEYIENLSCPFSIEFVVLGITFIGFVFSSNFVLYILTDG
jgi:hypothetical protein